MTALPKSRKSDWQAEERYLSRKIQQDQARLDEVREMLATFFPENRA